jgi:hypothetical protein
MLPRTARRERGSRGRPETLAETLERFRRRIIELKAARAADLERIATLERRLAERSSSPVSSAGRA